MTRARFAAPLLGLIFAASAALAQQAPAPAAAPAAPAAKAEAPGNAMEGAANLLICPNLDAANILFNVLKITGGNGLTIGPMLLGAAASAHILTPSSTMRRVLNQTALAVVNAQARR